MKKHLDETAHAGREQLDPEYVAVYDLKTGFDVAADIETLRGLGLGPETTVVDLGAGTGTLATAIGPLCRRVVAVDPSPTMVAAARAKGVECVEAGFLGYEHTGDAPQIVHSRNALHHLPDFWKALALDRVASMLAPRGRLVLRDIVYSFEPGDADAVLEAWFAAAPVDAANGWTRAELEEHVRDEHSTFSWLLEPMLERAGFEIDDIWYSDSRTYARYICTRP